MKTYTIRRTVTVTYEETLDFDAETEDDAIALATQSTDWDKVDCHPDDKEYDVESVTCHECDVYPCEHLEE